VGGRVSFVLACDLGGTGFRAALINAAGKTAAEAAIPAPSGIHDTHGCEIDADDWWLAFQNVSSYLAREDPRAFAAVAAIAICGVTRTQVFLGYDGQPLRPAITWRDTRAQEAADQLRARFSGIHPEADYINAFHPVARLAWLAKEQPDVFRSLTTVLEPKDYLNFRLTGALTTDPVSAARLLASARPSTSHAANLLTEVGALDTVLPPRREPWEVMGYVSKDLPSPLHQLAGLPVLCSSNDTWVGVVGLGAMRPGYAYNMSGTTEVLGIVSLEPRSADGLLTVDWRGLHQLGGPSQNGADTMAWLLSLLQGHSEGPPLGQALAEILRRSRDSQPLLFLPYLQGERVPYWDPSLRGAFIGLNRRHGATDLAWAVLEGVAFLNRIVLERAEAGLGQRVTEIRLGGGAAMNPIWRQVKADICRRPIVVGASPEPGVLGAAILGWTALGRFPSLTAAQDALAVVARRHEPDAARSRWYDDLYGLFRRSEAALAPISHDLAAVARPA
jgi:xylulokinase